MMALGPIRGFFPWLMMSKAPAGNEDSQPDASHRRQPRSAKSETRPSFDRVFRENYGYVTASVRRLGIPDDAVDDAVQDVFVVVARRLPEFEGRSAMRTWLFAIATRVVTHHRRTRGRHHRKVEALADLYDLHAAKESLSQVDDAWLLRRLLQTLDEDKRVVYILMEIEQRSAPEVSKMTGIKTATLHSRLRLARAALRREVTELFSEERELG